MRIQIDDVVWSTKKVDMQNYYVKNKKFNLLMQKIIEAFTFSYR